MARIKYNYKSLHVLEKFDVSIKKGVATFSLQWFH